MRKTIIFVIPTLIMLMAMGCITQQQDNQDATLQPQEVVALYFESWNKKDYSTMYALMSDGFKKIEPTASTLESFSAYAASQGIENVRLISAKETLNDGQTATVDYEVEFTAKGKVLPFKGAYTLKYRTTDTVTGWKLIHPYGSNIDLS